MMRPNFLVIGASKCGTTSLCSYLRKHPQIFIPEPKSTWFFQDDGLYENAGWEWYSRFFADGVNAYALGEGTDHYSWRHKNPETAERIARDLPHAKLIYIVRNPLKQIESLYMELVASGEENECFDRAIFENPHLTNVCRYSWQLEPFQRKFGAEKIKVCFFEDMIKDPGKFMKELYSFLQVDPEFKPQIDEVRNASIGRKYHDRMLTKVIRRISFAKKVDRRLGGSLRRVLKPILRKPIESRPQWNEEMRRWVVSQIKDESVEFLEKHGKDPDFWTLTID